MVERLTGACSRVSMTLIRNARGSDRAFASLRRDDTGGDYRRRGDCRAARGLNGYRQCTGSQRTGHRELDILRLSAHEADRYGLAVEDSPELVRLSCRQGRHVRRDQVPVPLAQDERRDVRHALVGENDVDVTRGRLCRHDGTSMGETQSARQLRDVIVRLNEIDAQYRHQCGRGGREETHDHLGAMRRRVATDAHRRDHGAGRLRFSSHWLGNS